MAKRMRTRRTTTAWTVSMLLLGILSVLAASIIKDHSGRSNRGTTSTKTDASAQTSQKPITRRLEPSEVEENQLDINPQPQQPQQTSSTNAIPSNQRFMAMMNIQDPCPTSTQHFSQYTDVLLSYVTTRQSDGTCSETCEISNELKVCNNQPNDALLKDLREQGKRIWIVFGGPTMGTVENFDLVVPACWEFCFGRQQQVVDALTTLVESNADKVNGVVISYQYMYQDGQNGSGFVRGDAAVTFNRELTTGLRDKVDDEKLLAHMPTDGSVVVGTPYFALMAELAQTNQYDLLMPQYFNGVTRPVSNINEAMQHFDILATFMFFGDATRIVFGLCNNGADEYCGGSEYSSDSVEAAGVIKSLTDTYPCHGGTFFWSSTSDQSGFWSTPLLQELTPTLDATDCAVIEEPEDKPDENDQYCQGLNVQSCSECIDNGCAWCNAEGTSTCLSKSNTTVKCSLDCNPTTPSQDQIWTSDSMIHHHVKLEGLSQEYFGITELLTESRQVLEEFHGRHVEEFFSSVIDPTLILDSNITIMEVILPSMFSKRSLRSHRKLQNGGSSVVVVYDQEVSYWYPVVEQMLSPETLSAVPFTTETARQDLIALLQSSNDAVLQQVLAVSEVLVEPQAPTEAPAIPPITTPAPTEPMPSNPPTLAPTFPAGTPSSNSPVLSPTIDSNPVDKPIGAPTSPPLTAPPANAPTPSQPTENGSPTDAPVLVTNPTQPAPSQPPVPPPIFNTNPPNPLPTPVPGPPPTNAPVPVPTDAPVPAPTLNPTNPPIPIPTSPPTPAPVPNPQQPEPAPAPKTDDGEPIFGEYTGLIVVAIVFVGLLAIFTIRMKFFMGEYVN